MTAFFARLSAANHRLLRFFFFFNAFSGTSELFPIEFPSFEKLDKVNGGII